MATGNSKKSDIWTHFILDKNTRKATCKADSSHILSYCGTTTNLWNHIKTQHGDIQITPSTKSAPPITNFFSPKSKFAHSTIPKKFHHQSPQQIAITDKLITFVARDYQPFSLVESDNFRGVLNALNPSYNIPSARTLKEKMEARYERILRDVKTFVNDSENTLCAVSTDLWTSLTQNDSYISLTGHLMTPEWEMITKNLEVKICPGAHSAANLVQRLKEMTEEWGIDISKTAVVRDSGANIKKRHQI